MTNTQSKKDPVPLSEREQEVLRCVARGATNQQIAAELHITLSTVKVHLRNIFAKINVSSRTEASLYALRTDLLSLDEHDEAPVADDTGTLVDDDSAPADPVLTHVPADEADTTAVDDVPPAPVAQPAEAEPLRAGAEIDASAETVPQEQEKDAALVAAAPQEQPVAQPAAASLKWPVVLIVGVVLATLLVGAGAWAAGVFEEDTVTVPESPTRGSGDVWLMGNIMQVPRTDFALASYDSDIYVIGGRTTAGVTGVMESYDVSTNDWTRRATKPTPVSDLHVIAIGRKFYAAGGTLESGSVSTAFEVYDPLLDQWSSLSALPVPRSQYAAVAFQGKLYLFGGWDGTTYVDDVWIFHPEENTWSDGTVMPAAQGRMGITLLKDQIHLMGGRDTDGLVSTHWSYDPLREAEGLNPWSTREPLPEPAEDLVVAAVLNDIYVFRPTSQRGLIYLRQNDVWNSFDSQLPANTLTVQGDLFSTDLHLFGASTEQATISFFHYHRQVIYQSHLPMIPMD
jgi:DNA-binding CsgD family transcriptional regulator